MSKHQKPSIPVAASPQSNNSNNTNGTPKVKKGFMKAITGPYIVHVAVPAILSLHAATSLFMPLSEDHPWDGYIWNSVYLCFCAASASLVAWQKPVKWWALPMVWHSLNAAAYAGCLLRTYQERNLKSLRVKRQEEERKYAAAPETSEMYRNRK